MSAVVLSAFSALSFAMSSVVTRRVVVRVRDAAVGTVITVPFSVIIFFLVLLAIGQVSAIGSFTWQGYAWLSTAGIVQFVIGRSIYFRLIRFVGANIASIMGHLQVVVAVVLGISLLGEPLTWRLVLGVFLLLFGLMITAINPEMLHDRKKILSGIPAKAYLMGLALGIAWGISPVLVKLGLGDSSSPVAGVFISYAAASIALSLFLWNRSSRATINELSFRTTAFFCVGGMFSSTAQLLKYVALSLGAVSMVTPVFSLSPILILLLSFLFNRKLDVFGIQVVIGVFTAVVGTLLLV